MDNAAFTVAQPPVDENGHAAGTAQSTAEGPPALDARSSGQLVKGAPDGVALVDVQRICYLYINPGSYSAG